jgi:hypothetical protein
MRNYFSTNVLWTALHMSRVVGELERADGRVPRFDMAHRSYAASSVTASATFLDAAVRELFQHADDGHGLRDDGYLAPLRPAAITTMAKVWRATNGGKNLDPLEKWQSLLECCGRDRLDRGAAPAQDAALLVRLRNTLVHFKPENVAADEEHHLEKRLRGPLGARSRIECSTRSTSVPTTAALRPAAGTAVHRSATGRASPAWRAAGTRAKQHFTEPPSDRRSEAEVAEHGPHWRRRAARRRPGP